MPILEANMKGISIWEVYDSTHRQRHLSKRRQEQSSKSCMLVAITKRVKAKYEGASCTISENYLAIYDLPLDTDLNTLDHYPSVWIGKKEFE